MSILKGVYTVCLIYFLYTLIFGLAFFFFKELGLCSPG